MRHSQINPEAGHVARFGKELTKEEMKSTRGGFFLLALLAGCGGIENEIHPIKSDDTGDTGDTGGTGDTGDTGDTGTTSSSGNSGSSSGTTNVTGEDGGCIPLPF